MHRTTPRFWQYFDKLPEVIKNHAKSNFQLLRENPRHPSLHFKRIGKVWSARIGLAPIPKGRAVHGALRPPAPSRPQIFNSDCGRPSVCRAEPATQLCGVPPVPLPSGGCAVRSARISGRWRHRRVRWPNHMQENDYSSSGWPNPASTYRIASAGSSLP